MYMTRHRNRYDRYAPDMWLMLAAFSLTIAGLVMVYSASQYEGLHRFSNITYLASKQFVWVGIAALAFVGASMVDFRWVKQFPTYLIGGAILILLLTHFMAEKTLGAASRIRVGSMSIQPSEFAKLLVLLYWATTLSQVKSWDHFFKNSKNFTPLILVGLALGLVLKEPDMGGAAILGCMVMALWYLKGMPLHILGGSMGVLGLLGLKVAMSNPYQAARLTAFLDPWAHQYGKGYNAVQSMLAFANGGFKGVGLGNGAQKFDYLPEQHADFIFSVIGEEFGLLGTLTIAFLFAVILWRGMAIARRQKDDFSQFLATGIVCVLVGQALLNMLVAVSAVPTTGLTMPFVSYGGSSLLVSAMMVGILVKLSACKKETLSKQEDSLLEKNQEELPRFVVPQPPAMKNKVSAENPRAKGVMRAAKTGNSGRGNRGTSLPRY